MKGRHAVLVIHGMGEQQPMGTIRGLVGAVLRSEKSPTYWSKPDLMSRSFELRVLKGRDRGRTDFYEYYWAHKLTGTNISHVLTWLAKLMLRRPWKVSPGLKSLWIAMWVLSLIALYAIAAGLVNPPDASQTGFLNLWRGVFHNRMGTWSLLLAGASLGFQYFLIHYMGDAARYLSPSPENIDLRQKIRADGVTLLERLHKNGKYERITVVGHSLGSVIGYDILRAYWSSLHALYDKPHRQDQAALKQVEHLASEPLTDAWIPAQRALLEEQTALGHRWRVAHFITMGSPLAHAAMLMACDLDELRLRQAEKELPTCPPNATDGPFTFVIKPPFKTDEGLTTLRTLDHAALFACTRWTNFYIPAHGGLLGDFVGGPLRPVFGPGITDQPVQSRRGLANWSILGHISYWTASPHATPDSATEALRKALDL
jgi:hypothetical protein